jgi:hypothetical protein
MTKSEELFEAFCLANAVRAERIQATGQKTPDYMLSFGKGKIIAEVKQFDAGPTERRTLRKKPEELDEADAFYDGVPGERVRSKIDSAMPQLKTLSGGILPNSVEALVA